MAHALPLLPALTLQLQLQGLATLGLDVARVRRRVGPLPDAPDALVPTQAYLDMWDEAHALFGQPGLPSALAMAIPFGAFGALDYLVGSANTLAASCESAQLHFAMVASDVWLELAEVEDGHHLLGVRGIEGLSPVALEFTLACIVKLLGSVSDGPFRPVLVGLPIARPANDPVRARIYGEALVYGYPRADILIDHATWQRKLARADPYLHTTLQRVAAQLQLTRPGDTGIESAVRARLRGALSQGQATPARVATLLGVSERTLQRRLAEGGHSFSEVLEGFRRDESARLLCDPKLALTEVATRLGYAEQTSFTRAFRRWTGHTPGAWRTQRQA
jgi:AraC-like DNA-binding protein